MKILIVTPSPARSQTGNRITALRWGRILRELGHRVVLQEEYRGGRYDLVIVLHARRSFGSIQLFRERFPQAPLLLALTGTDLYHDIHIDPRAQQALALATRLIVLQPLGLDELPAPLRRKGVVIYQSVAVPLAIGRAAKKSRAFTVCVMGHLRPVKDPWRAAQAARRLPSTSKIQVVHVGGALSQSMEKQALGEQARNPRYHWLGEAPRAKALRILARSRLLVHSSRMEGGANVISEALALSVPVLSSEIPGSIGILGPEYPGYFPVGDTRALAALMQRAELDMDFYHALASHCESVKPLVEPARERTSWKELLTALFPALREKERV
ncbi:MAG: TIGR04348 family glycosyltransferase [Acidobacteria bacterium]|nr:TIGR04348 family glycosyltransferase [Acidobacteriota bacterium]MBI3657861.1 TIGR04348 family glycosyltransferase [Acidobacteriota bacterium]